ncbi:hypothetical protein SOVF_078540 [Spinacia oleracea]|nr:hypothetical protein SOVF_078540 [Spinacia oleracea]
MWRLKTTFTLPASPNKGRIEYKTDCFFWRLCAFNIEFFPLTL